MATVREINGTQVKERHPFGVWALSFITLGIYYWVWYYKVNKEMRRAHDIDVDPAMAVVAITFGSFLIIPPFISLYKTGRRVERAQGKGGLKDRLSPVISFLLAFLFALHIVYLQSNLNKLWRHGASEEVAPALDPSSSSHSAI